MKALGLGLLAAAAALVLVVEGAANPFAYWNLAPLALGAALVARGRAPAATAVFVALSAGPIALFHLAWRFDWAATATGSSTSAVAFVFVPMGATALGAAGAVAVRAIAGCLARSRAGGAPGS